MEITYIYTIVMEITYIYNIMMEITYTYTPLIYFDAYSVRYKYIELAVLHTTCFGKELSSSYKRLKSPETPLDTR